MFNHAPDDYQCPFCARLAGAEDELGGQADPTHHPDHKRGRTSLATAFVCPRAWPNNVGHVLVIPNAHHENIYDLPPEYGHAVHDLVRETAIAIRETYDCDGTSVRQHNEPAGNQDVWHYHVHVFPRYQDDDLYGTPPLPGFLTAEQRGPYAERLRLAYGLSS